MILFLRILDSVLIYQNYESNYIIVLRINLVPAIAVKILGNIKLRFSSI
jgi:hypothetical protein